MAASLPSQAQTLRVVEGIAGESLPPAWSLRFERGPRDRRGRVGALWTLASPDGVETTFAVEVRRSILGRQLDEVLADLAASRGRPLIAASYIGPTLARRLADREVSFIDTTGNVRFVASRPGLFVERQGATKDPWPQADVLQSLRGRAAGRALRALVDFPPPYGVRALAKRASVSLGSLSRTLELLDREGLVKRAPRGEVEGLDWEAAIRRWSQDYAFSRSNQISPYLDPRGIASFAERLAGTRLAYAATGAFADQSYDPVAPARRVALYVAEPLGAAETLKLRAADSGANVVLVEAFDPVVFERTTRRDGLTVVAASQLAVDLLTGPGREPSQGEEMISWMRANEDAWRA